MPKYLLGVGRKSRDRVASVKNITLSMKKKHKFIERIFFYKKLVNEVILNYFVFKLSSSFLPSSVESLQLFSRFPHACYITAVSALMMFISTVIICFINSYSRPVFIALTIGIL